MKILFTIMCVIMCAVPPVWGLPAQSPVNIEFDGLVYSEDDARIRVEELREEAENLEKMLQKRFPPGTCSTTPNYKVKITIAGREYSTQNNGNPSIRVEFKVYSNYRNETSFPPVRRHYIDVFPKDAAGINRFRTFDFSEFTLTEDPDNLNDYLHYHFSLSDYDTTADAFKAATEFGLTLATLTARAIQEFGYTSSVDIAEMKNVSNVCWTWMFPLLDFTNTSEMKDIKIYSTDSELLERITELENELTDCRQDYADLMSAFDPGDCPECPVPAECPEIPECPDCVLDTTTIISELRGDFDRLEGSVNGSVGRMRQTISTQEGTIGSQTATITNQTTTIAGLNAAIAERNTTIANLNTTIAAAGGDLTALVAERDALQAQADTLTASLATMTAARNTAISERDTISASLATMTASRDTAINERDSLQGQLTAANASIATLTADLATMTTARDSLQTQLNTANTSITTLTANLATMTTARDTAISERDSLQSQLDTANGTISTQTTTITARDATIATQTGTIADRDSTISGLTDFELAYFASLPAIKGTNFSSFVASKGAQTYNNGTQNSESSPIIPFNIDTPPGRYYLYTGHGGSGINPDVAYYHNNSQMFQVNTHVDRYPAPRGQIIITESSELQSKGIYCCAGTYSLGTITLVPMDGFTP